MGSYTGPKPLALEQPLTRFHANTLIKPENLASGEVGDFVRPSKARGLCNPTPESKSFHTSEPEETSSTAKERTFINPRPEHAPRPTQALDPSQLPAAGKRVPRHPVVRLGVLDPQGATFNEKTRVWELHNHDTTMPPLNADGSPALRHADEGPEQWGWVVNEPGLQAHRPGASSPQKPYMAWNSTVRSSQLRQERETLGPDTLYTKTMTPEQEAAYALHACDTSLAPKSPAQQQQEVAYQEWAMSGGAAAQAPFGTDFN